MYTSSMSSSSSSSSSGTLCVHHSLLCANVQQCSWLPLLLHEFKILRVHYYTSWLAVSVHCVYQLVMSDMRTQEYDDRGMRERDSAAIDHFFGQVTTLLTSSDHWSSYGLRTHRVFVT